MAGEVRRSRAGPDTLVVPVPAAALEEITRQRRWCLPAAQWPRSPAPTWLAFLELAPDGMPTAIRFFARVRALAGEDPVELQVEGPRTLGRGVPVLRPRAIRPFGTSFALLLAARSINDLFPGTPASNRLWEEFQRASIRAEREWLLEGGGTVEFVVFCRGGAIAVSVSSGPLPAIDPTWHLVRVSPRALRTALQATVAEVIAAIEQLGGLAPLRRGPATSATPWPAGTPLQTSFAEV